MKTTTLKVYEAINLEAEADYLLKLKAPIKLKFELTELLLKIQSALTAARQILTELFKEHGSPDPNNQEVMLLPQFKPGTNEKTGAFIEYETINNQDIELTYKPIDIDLFQNIESDQNFPVLFRLIQ